MNATFYIQWHITNACNLRCLHCYQDDFTRTKDLDWRSLRKVADSIFTGLGAWGRKASIHLTGGEPLLKPELFPLLAHLNRHPMVEELGIITNGLLMDREMVKRLVSFRKLRKIKISLEGGDEDTHDSIRPPGTFRRVMENLPRLKEEGPKFEVLLMFTAMKRNYQSLPSLIRLSQKTGVQGLIIERYVPWGRGRAIREEVLEKHQWKELVEGLLKFFSIEIGKEEIASFQAFQVDFQAGEPELMGAPCVLGEDGLCIMPEGIIYPCRRFPLSLGSLLEDSLLAIWERSDILRKIRDKKNLKGHCGRCNQEGCTGCRSLAYSLTGDFFGEDPHCFYS
jgi:radical SAM protein with 4Fe4S-binding SPASM domain